MKNLIKKLGSQAIHKSRIFKLASFDTRILAFHTVNPKYFEKQIKHLVKHYKVVPLSEVFSNNKNAVALTFDDGYKNNIEYAYPILKKYNVPATVFIIYDFIDSNTFAWWDRLEFSGKNADFKKLKNMHPDEIEREIYKLTGLRKNDKKPAKYNFMNWNEISKIMDVFEIGSHTITHSILTNISLDEAKKEIFGSKKKIGEKLGKKVTSFAYPNGNYNEDLTKLVSEAGYNYAVIYEKGKNTEANRYALHRRGINVNDDLAIFATKVAGVF